MEFDRKTHLGIVLMQLIANKRFNSIQPSSKLAIELRISISYLQQVCKPLCEHNLINSYRGPNGGYCLAKSAEAISVGDVIKAMNKPSTKKHNTTSKEYLIWIDINKGLLNYLDSLSIKFSPSNKPATSEYVFSQINQVSYMQKLII